MTKEARAAVKFILIDISQNECISRPRRMETLLGVVKSIPNIDENLISRDENLGLRVKALDLINELIIEENNL